MRASVGLSPFGHCFSFRGESPNDEVPNANGMCIVCGTIGVVVRSYLGRETVFIGLNFRFLPKVRFFF